MAVQSTTFGGVRLTGDDATAFRKQIDREPAKEEAVEGLKVARKELKGLFTDGYVKVTLGKR